MIRTRAARLDELRFLQAKHTLLAEEKHHEKLDLAKSVVLVAEDNDDSLTCGLIAARMVWQVEPLVLFPEFERTSSKMAKKRATYLLARAVESFIADPASNPTPVKFFFSVIENRNPRMQDLARHIGWQQVYPGCKIFGKDV